MKKVILILSLLIFLIPFSSASAYTGGLLHGKPINMGSAFGITSKIGLNVTDGDIKTYETMAGPGLNPDTFWYEFSNEKTIDSYAVISSAINMKFYDQNKNLILTIISKEVINGGVIKKITPIRGVKYVMIENSYATSKVYEWDVFEVPPINYEEIKNLSATGIAEKEITLNWDNPSNNADFVGAKVYRDNQMLRQLGKTVGKLTDSSLFHSTNYSYRVSAVYSDGYETPGITLNATTATPPPPPPPPPAIPAVTGATIESNNGYLVKWATPITGDIQLIVGGKNYAIIPASNLSYTIPSKDMKYTGIFNDPDVAMFPIDSLGRQTVTVRPQIVGGGNIGQVKTPFNANELLKVIIGLVGLVGMFILLALAFNVAPKLKKTVTTAVGEKDLKGNEVKGRTEREGRAERVTAVRERTEKPLRAAKVRERIERPHRAARVRERTERPQKATRERKQTTREKERAENGL